MTSNFFRTNLPLKAGGKYIASPSQTSSQHSASTSPENLVRCSTREARRLLSYEYASKYSILPLGVMSLMGRDVLSVAAPGPLTPEVQSGIQFITNLEVRCIECKRDVIERAVCLAYKGDDETLRASATNLAHYSKEMPSSNCSHTASQLRSAKGVVPQFLETLLEYACSRNASDIHINPRREGTFISLRVDGQILTHGNPLCSSFLHKQLVNRIKVLAGLDISSPQIVHEGQFSLSIGDSVNCLRVSIIPTIHGEKIVLRLHGNLELKELHGLGLNAGIIAVLEEIVAKPGGLVLFTGPTGSGKTTTMYAVLEELRRKNMSLASIEDPVEIILPGISQTNIDNKRGLSYSECIKAILRQDPDCILLGEIRDSASALGAFQAARTGHMVISTIHGGSFSDVILRLEEFGVSPIAIAHGLRAILNQRLILALCPDCKVIDLTMSNYLNVRVYRAVGCRQCDYSGNKGRVPISEALSFTEEVRHRIVSNGLSSVVADHFRDSTSKGLAKDFEVLLRNGTVSQDSFRE